MPIAEHSIEALDALGAPFAPVVKQTFLSWKGSILLEQESSELLQRVGVDGHGYRRLGKRGKPFKLVSTLDVETINDGRLGYQLYIDSFQLQNPCRILKDGVNWGTYVVQSIELVRLFAVGGMAGGFGPTAAIPYESNFILTCRWSLMFVAGP